MRNPLWLKVARIQLGLSMEEVGKECFLTKQTISNIEKGKGSKSSTLLYTLVIEKKLEESNIKILDLVYSDM